MPRAAAKQSAPLALVCGEDEFAVKQRAKQIYLQWTEEVGGMDHEIIDAAASNSGEALKALAKLREALQTLPFFGSGKVVWLRNCNFLGDEPAASTQAVTDSLVELAQELKEFGWENVRLLISAGKVDKRKVFYKALDKLGSVESFAGWSADDKDWAGQAELVMGTPPRARAKHSGARLRPGRCVGRPRPAAPAALPGRGAVGAETGPQQIGDRVALRTHCQSPRNDYAEGDAARRVGKA